MRLKLLALLVLLVALPLWSQKTTDNDFAISLNGNKITTTSDFKQQFKNKKSTAKQNPETEYSLLQFTKIPSLEEQEKLKSKGITLLSYLSNNAYYVEIAPEFYNKNNVSDNIRAVVAVDPKYKLDQRIANNAIPDYALIANNGIKAVISYFKGVDDKRIERDLAGLFLKNTKNKAFFNEIYVQTSKEKLEQIAKFNWVQNIELAAPPVESNNKLGVTSHKANVLGSTIPGLGYGLTGKGVKVGIWDGNLEPHKDHTGRVINREYESNSSHGAHVAGTIGGAGLLDPKARGMAPEVQMYGWNFNLGSNGLSVPEERVKAANEDGIEITSNSFGPGLLKGYNTFRYNSDDRGEDYVTVKFPHLLSIYANGNSQEAYPEGGGFTTGTNNPKNALLVAANNPDDLISSYSSFGPTIDGRLIPQIAAVGTDVYSLDYNNSYQTLSGTSMATPGTTGTVALLYERYKNIYDTKPLASLMKALVTGTANDAGNPGPDYKYGFGNLNGLRAVRVLDNKMFYTESVSNGQSYEKEIVVPAGLVSLKVMLAYTDVQGTPGSPSILINDLDVKMVKDGVTTLPWVLNPLTPNVNAVRGVDNLNNIEQITLDHPAAGTYKIIVSGTRVPIGTQEFSVVYDYVAPDLALTYPIGGEKINTDTTEYIRWEYEGEPKTFTLEYSVDGGINYKVIAKDIPSAARNFEWKVPAGIVASAKVRVIAGSKVATSTEVFTIMTEPKNLVIAPSACGVSSYKMDWDPIVGAKYEVLKMNGYKFDVVATVTSPTYTFTLSAGDDNWFSVRSIDIATGLVSERVRAVNAGPVSEAVVSAVTLPFEENFNSKKANNYVFSKGTAGTINYEYINTRFVYGVQMAGSEDVPASPWVASTSADAFTNNPDFIKKVSFCDVNASSMAGKTLGLKFNLIWNSTGPENKNFFRLLVNGIPVKSAEDVGVYGGTVLRGNTELTYDLSAYAGTTFSIAFESVIDNDVIVSESQGPLYSNVFIDNVSIFEATATDLKLTSLVPNTGLTAAETVKIKVFNNSPVAISNVPVSYQIDAGAEVVETIAGPINPLSEVAYDFVQKADFSTPKLYTVVGKVNYTGDAVTANNSIQKRVSNIGSDILMGSVESVTTCAATFTDGGTRYENYEERIVIQLITFKPAIAGNILKVTFSAFNLDQASASLIIYNGDDTSVLLGSFTGNTLPPSLISTAEGGELTFAFLSTGEGATELGWIADISCVAKSMVNDAAVTSIKTPEVLGKKTSTNDITIRVKNFGSTDVTNLPVFYQVNGGPKVTDVVPVIEANGKLYFTFATKADLSTVGATYTIKVGIDLADDNPANNTFEKVVYHKNELPVHTNTDGYAISRLKWDAVVNTSGITAYSDFKNIKIPVYAGTTYQPEVSITRLGAPIPNKRYSSGDDEGVFTMIVIDLNGNGNLTDEFYAGTFWVNTTLTSPAPAIQSTTSTHYFEQNSSTREKGLTIPVNTTSGEKLMRVIHMFRSPSEGYHVNLGPTTDGLTSSRDDFEVEEYTINVLPFSAADASVESILTPVKPGNAPVEVTALIRNYSASAISNFPVAYRVNGGKEVVENVALSIKKGENADFTFTTKADLGAPGDYTIEVYTKLPADVDSANDSKSVTLSHASNSTNVTGTFDGVDDFIKINSTPALNLTNNYTYELWVNQKKPSIFGRLLDKGKVIVFVHNNNELSAYKENSLVIFIKTAKDSYVINTGLNSIKQNTWHHIAYTVSDTNEYKVYIDGVSVPFTTKGIAEAADSNSDAVAYIGNNWALARGLNGSIDEVRIWSGVRDQATIAANTTTKYVGNEVGLLAYYSLSEGDKPFVFDSSPSDNTAVVTNADTNGMGEEKFWNVPVLLQKVEFVNQQASSYDAATKTFSVYLNNGVDLTTAIANYTLGMNSIVKIGGVTQVNGVTPNDFSNPVTLTVEGVGFNTGITQTYTVKVSRSLGNESKLLSYDFKTASNPGLTKEINTDIAGNNVTKTVPFGYNVTNLVADFTVSPGAELFVDGVKQMNSKVTASDYSNSFVVTVVGENKLQTNYTVDINAKNSQASILSYSVANQIGKSTIDPVLKTVKVVVNNNANLSALVPVVQVSDFATLRIGTYIQNSGVTPLNYTKPVVYNVLAQNRAIENWTVTIEAAKPVITLSGEAAVSIDKGCVYKDAGYTAKDNLNTDITTSVVVSGTVDVNSPGQYVITYTVKDAAQNESKITRTVTVSSTACTLGVPVNVIEGFVMYPNPVTEGKLHIESASASVKNILISDMSGKKVYSVKTEKTEINVSGLPSGVYIIKVEQDGNTTVQKLIIK
ncbi:S8 family serine peptidase [Flavobacterium sp.]|uniref:S8 family serine peptidase n=1 Tax=Flavobacterium sp. TaxID=239 RepID=UPI0025BDCE77|nr:S8 family serine peptidase [Flavobacterium sp.]